MDESIRPKNPRDLDSSCEAPPDDHDETNDTAARDIMADPARAAGMSAQPAFLQAPPGTPEQVQLVLNILPGLIGAIDEAVRDQTGVRTGLPFCLVIFAAQGAAIHASNFNPAAAKKALIDFGESLKTAQPQAEAANDRPC